MSTPNAIHATRGTTEKSRLVRLNSIGVKTGVKPDSITPRRIPVEVLVGFLRNKQSNALDKKLESSFI
jgi:hypothetical protein